MPGSVTAVTLPARFVATTAHLIATLTVFFDADNITKRALKSDQSDFSDERDSLLFYVWFSIVCFGIEYIGLFSGVSMFLPTVSVMYIAAHSVGTVLVGLFSTEVWDLDYFSWFFGFFSLIPAATEALMAFLVLKLNILDY